MIPGLEDAPQPRILATIRTSHICRKYWKALMHRKKVKGLNFHQSFQHKRVWQTPFRGYLWTIEGEKGPTPQKPFANVVATETMILSLVSLSILVSGILGPGIHSPPCIPHFVELCKSWHCDFQVLMVSRLTHRLQRIFMHLRTWK